MLFCRYTLLVGKPPFETSSLKETYMRIKRNEYLIPSKVGHTAQLLIIKLLRPDPSTRPTMDEILGDDFFTKGYIPARLPVSCLTTEPRFPRESISSYQTSRKPLLELNSRASEANGAVKLDPRNKRKSLGVRVIAGEISQMVLPGQNGAEELLKQQEEGTFVPLNRSILENFIFSIGCNKFKQIAKRTCKKR